MTELYDKLREMDLLPTELDPDIDEEKMEAEVEELDVVTASASDSKDEGDKS